VQNHSPIMGFHLMTVCFIGTAKSLESSRRKIFLKILPCQAFRNCSMENTIYPRPKGLMRRGSELDAILPELTAAIRDHIRCVRDSTVAAIPKAFGKEQRGLSPSRPSRVGCITADTAGNQRYLANAENPGLRCHIP
jgi:hypothetical protein